VAANLLKSIGPDFDRSDDFHLSFGILGIVPERWVLRFEFFFLKLY